MTALSGELRLESVITAIRDKFSGDLATRNIATARAAHDAARAA